MNHLICHSNRQHFYKKSGHLVRTPIRITLTADEFAYYVVAGDYQPVTHLPKCGFIDSATYDHTIEVGYKCINSFFFPTSPYQIWRKTTINPIPTAWYQGTYATSAPSFSSARLSSEACMWIGAVHFTVPSDFISAGLTCTDASCKIYNLGDIIGFDSPAIGSSANVMWKTVFPNEPYSYQLFAGTELDPPSEMMYAGYPTNFISTNDTGNPRTAFDLWKFGTSGKDGGIFKLQTPVEHTQPLNDDQKSVLNSGEIWLSLIMPCLDGGPTYYLPYFVPPEDSTPCNWSSSGAYIDNKLTVEFS